MVDTVTCCRVAATGKQEAGRVRWDGRVGFDGFRQVQCSLEGTSASLAALDHHVVTKRCPRLPLSTAEPSLVVPKPMATTEVPGASVRSLAGSCTAAFADAESSSSRAIWKGDGGRNEMGPNGMVW